MSLRAEVEGLVISNAEMKEDERPHSQWSKVNRRVNKLPFIYIYIYINIYILHIYTIHTYIIHIYINVDSKLRTIRKAPFSLCIQILLSGLGGLKAGPLPPACLQPP